MDNLNYGRKVPRIILPQVSFLGLPSPELFWTDVTTTAHWSHTVMRGDANIPHISLVFMFPHFWSIEGTTELIL